MFRVFTLNFYLKIGQPERALKCRTEQVVLLQEHQGAAHRLTISAMEKLASLYTKLEMPEKAAATLRQIAELSPKAPK